MKKNKIAVGVFGSTGRMGKELSRLLENHKTLVPEVGVSKEDKNKDFSKNFHNLKDPDCVRVDVWIDFSEAQSFDLILSHCLKNNIPLVSGTTGLSVAQKKKMQQASKKIPILWASNMGLGVAALQRAMTAFQNLEGFDFQIEEIHHRHKKDRPSGTAVTLQRHLVDLVGGQVPPPLSIRGGGVFGVHKVYAFSEDEVLCFEHQALNRTVFARGALRATSWIHKQGPGLYTIEDVL